jgi:hydrogenase nickel incorporation protein HypA/HybF
MHETSLARALLSQVDDLCAAHGGGSVGVVRVEIGPLSGVEPSLLVAAFERLRGETAWSAAAELQVDEVPLEVRCLACRHVFQPARFRFRCAACNSADTEVARGDGVLLESISIAQAQRGAVP